MIENRAFIEVELSEELSETLRLFCEAGNEQRDEVIAAAVASYFRVATGPERTGAVPPLKVV